MIGITPRKGDKVLVQREVMRTDARGGYMFVDGEQKAVFLRYEKGRPVVRWPNGNTELLTSDEYMRVA